MKDYSSVTVLGTALLLLASLTYCSAEEEEELIVGDPTAKTGYSNAAIIIFTIPPPQLAEE